MEDTDELKDYSYRKICDDCTVCLSVTFLSHTFEKGKNDDSKEESLTLHFFYMFSDYVTFLFRNKRCYSSNFQLSLSCYS